MPKGQNLGTLIILTFLGVAIVAGFGEDGPWGCSFVYVAGAFLGWHAGKAWESN